MKTKKKSQLILSLLVVLILALAAGTAAPTALASGESEPTTVTLVGSLQSQLGCTVDWQPTCAATALVYDPVDDVWQGTFGPVMAGNYEYKVALNNSWDENYGLNAQRSGANIPISIPSGDMVKFYYDAATHWITSDHNPVIATVPGSFQTFLGCPGNWQPDCLRSWLRNPDGDNIYDFTTERLPAGNYAAKVALNESWTENYGVGGVPNGPSIPFTISNSCDATRFAYNSTTHVLDIQPVPAAPRPSSVTITGTFQSELDCSGDWQPNCAATHLNYDSVDGVWQGVFTIPAGSWEYKVALNDSWDEHYGVNATLNGSNIALNLSAATTVKFYYSNETHWVTDNYSRPIFTAPGSYQTELGCAGAWDPGCLRSWLQDPDGDGIYRFSDLKISPGNYEVKVAVNESWDVNYGEGGVQNGPNISFSVPEYCTPTSFQLNGGTHILTVPPPGGTVDTDPPLVAVTGVSDGAAYILGAVPQAGCSTTDDDSGVAQSATLSLTGGSSLGVGSFTAACSGALDNAGNAADPVSVNYSVTFLFTGFSSPVDNNGVLNIAKAGQTIPLKFRITDANGCPITNLTSVTVTAVSLSCPSGVTTDLLEEYSAGSSGLQNLGDGYYQWNWKTPTTYVNSCKTLKLNVGEGAGFEHIALFQFRK